MADGTCNVSLYDDDGDAASVYHTSTVTARKAHRCYECGETMAPGQRYERVSGLWEGTWSTYRFCLPCAEVGSEFSDGGRTFGALWEGCLDQTQEGV